MDRNAGATQNQFIKRITSGGYMNRYKRYKKIDLDLIQKIFKG